MRDFPCHVVNRLQVLVFISLLPFALLILFTEARSQTPLVINTADTFPNSTHDFKGMCDRVMTDAFRRMGIPLTIVHHPSERALINANEGIDDGNFARIDGMDTMYPNLLRVPEEITKFEFVAFARNLKFRTLGWESLKPYNIGIITGWKILENNVTDTKSLTKVAIERILFNLLKLNRVDIVVYDRRQGIYQLRKLNIDDVSILEPPLAVRSMYFYLNKNIRV